MKPNTKDTCTPSTLFPKGDNADHVPGPFWPLFLRYPGRAKHCPFTGWNNSQFERAKNGGFIEAHVLKLPDKNRGIVMFDALSVYRYIKSLPLAPVKPKDEKEKN